MSVVGPAPGIRTTCAYCGVGCGVIARPDGRGGATISGDSEHPANFGRLCVKGAALGETVGAGERVLHPLINGTRTTWSRALDAVARGFGETLQAHGPDSVAFYLSGQLLTEDYYVANKLIKGFIGSAHCDTNSRLCMASTVAGQRRAFGADVVPACYEDIEEADLIILVGSNAAWCHPVLHQRMLAAQAGRGVRLINIDVRRTATSVDADLNLTLAPGTDAVLFSWLLVQICEGGGLDREYVARHTTGLGEALAQAKVIAPDLAEVARATGLDAADISTFVAWFMAHPRTLTCFSQGVNQSAQGTDKVNAILNCHLASGRIGKPGSGPLSLTGQPNAMGGREVGGLSNQLAAHMGFAPDDIARVERFWGSAHMARREGRKAVDLFDAVARGEIKALWILHTNPAVSMPRADFVRGSLGRLDHLVVSEAFAGVDGLLERAHVVLPASPWGEKDGTVTNSERRISRQRRFVEPQGEAKPDWWALSEVARRMGFAKAFPYQSAHEIFCEHAALSAFENDGSRAFNIGGLAGLSRAAYDGLAPVQWPLPAGKSPSGRMFAGGGFFTSDSRARLVAVASPALREPTTARFPLILNTGRVRDHWHTMTRTGLSARLSTHIREPFVAVAPEDAAALGLDSRAYARLRTAHASAVLRVEITPQQPQGQVFAPIHWNDATSGQGRVSALMGAHVDPLSGQPESKAAPARLEKIDMRSFGFLATRRHLSLPRWLVHARFAIAGGEGVVFACECPPADLYALIANYLPDSGQRATLRDEGAGRYRTLVTSRAAIETLLHIGPLRDDAALDMAIRHFAAPEHDSRLRRALLAGHAAEAVDQHGPVICVCNNVHAGSIRAHRAAGARDLASIGAACKAGTTCGSCRPEISVILAEPVAATIPIRQPEVSLESS
ncbi:MAG: molybdopterin-dependent oxidoreductase [Hyphomicrobiales bacterium]|nr:molybdopterin-dependent oxidoreductase [Hyphomicrobiales bacterium]